MFFYPFVMEYSSKKILTYLSLFLILLFPLIGKESPSNFLVLSPPKCGTFLVGKALEMITKKTAHYCLTDLYYNENSFQLIEDTAKNHSFVIAHSFDLYLIKYYVNRGFKVIFIIRDPRDQLISAVNWIREGQWPWLPVSNMSNYHDQVKELITGQIYGQNAYDIFLRKQIETILNLKQESLYITRFENLVGASGGGKTELQNLELINMSKFLGYSSSSHTIETIGQNLFNGTLTFRKGQIGQWKEDFLPQHKKLYKLLYGQLLIRLGYEKDLKW